METKQQISRIKTFLLLYIKFMRHKFQYVYFCYQYEKDIFKKSMTVIQYII